MLLNQVNSNVNRKQKFKENKISFPQLSLAQLQQNYHQLKQVKKNKHKYSKSNATLSTLGNLQQQIQIKSPFYDRSKVCKNKMSCKCQFHKKKKYQLQIKFKFINKKSSSDAKSNLYNCNKLESMGNEQGSQANKQNYHKRFKSLENDFNISNAMSNNRGSFFNQKKILDQKLYNQYLKQLKQQKTSNINCYNTQFQEFIKSNDQWILRQFKHKNSFSKKRSNSKDQTGNNTKNRFRTAPSIHRSSQNQLNVKKFEKTIGKSSNNIDQFKRTVRKQGKKNTTLGFYNHKESAQSNSFSKMFNNLKSEDKQKLQVFIKNALKDLGLNIQNFEPQNLQNSNFFTVLCQNLLDSDSNVIEQAKSVLRRISRLPLNLFNGILNQIKSEIKQGFSINCQLKADQMEKAVSIALETLQNSVQTMVKKKEQSKGRQKLSILGKLKGKFTGRGSLNIYKAIQSKNKLRFSNSQQLSSISKQNIDSKRSRFAIDRNGRLKQSQGIQSQQEINNAKSQKDQLKFQSKQDSIGKQKPKQFKKGPNMRKILKNDTIMKRIDEQIEFQSKKKTVTISSNITTQIEQQYLKQRAESRRRLRDQQSKKQLQFLSLMRQKQQLRQSSTMSECEMKKNNLRSHFQRNKIFIKKMQMSLANNTELKQMVINLEDDLFTKKRKVRILKHMIAQKSVKETQFCQQIKKYVEIFQKNCNMIVGKDNGFQLKKYTRRKLETQKFFDYEVPDDEKLKFPPIVQDLTQLLKSENQLKFYSVNLIQLQQQDYQSLHTDISIAIHQSIKHSVARHKNIWFPSKQNRYHLNLYDNNQLLIQTGLQQKFEASSLDYWKQGQKDQVQQDIQITGCQQSQDIKKIVRKFNKNMDRFQKIFKKDKSRITFQSQNQLLQS